MPREARNKYDCNFFHVMTQGINKEKIFYDDKYKRIYIKSIFDNAKKFNIEIIAYCIMINHAHLLLKVDNIQKMSEFMKVVNMKYAMIYNNMENRVGVVFRNRFKSENIYDEKYFYNCIQYIHNNPVKAGIIEEAKEYRFSSANDYDLDKVSGILKGMVNKKEEGIVNFIDTEDDKKIVTMKNIIGVINSYKTRHNLIEINLKNKEIVREVIVKIKEETEANNTEIARAIRCIKVHCF